MLVGRQVASRSFPSAHAPLSLDTRIACGCTVGSYKLIRLVSHSLHPRAVLTRPAARSAFSVELDSAVSRAEDALPASRLDGSTHSPVLLLCYSLHARQCTGLHMQSHFQKLRELAPTKWLGPRQLSEAKHDKLIDDN